MSVRDATLPQTRRRSLAQRMETSPGRFLLLFSAIYAAAEICLASRRPLIFDELIASTLADLPDIRQIWPLIRQGIELNPPLPFWLNWIVHHTIGHGEVMSRLPAIAGFWLMCVCLYHFVRRRTTRTYGFIALLLPLFTYTAWDSTVARGYGLMLGLSALALLSWQVASDGVRRKVSLAGLAIGIAGAVSSHYYAVYVAGAIGLGELVRTAERKRVDASIWAAWASGLSPLILYAELLKGATVHATTNFWVSPGASPVARFLYDSYGGLFGPAALVIVLLLAVTLWMRRAEGGFHGAPESSSRAGTAACLALAAMPFVFFSAAMVAPVPFYTRYVQPVVIGFTILLAMTAYRVGGRSRRFPELAISLVVWFCFAPWACWQFGKLAGGKPPDVYREYSRKLPLQSGLPIVFDGDSTFLEYFHYSPPEVKARIYGLLNADAAVRYRGSDTTQRSLQLAQTLRDLHAVDYRRFLAGHPEFLLIRPNSESWVIQALLADGARLELVSMEKGLGYFERGACVYRVRVAPGL